MRRALLLAGVLLLAGCTSTVSGQGSGPRVPPSPTASTPTTTRTPVPAPTSSAPPAGIGNPGTADLCRSVQAASFKASLDDPQYAGSCSLTVNRGGASEMGLSVTALSPDATRPRIGGTTRHVEGLSVVAYPDDQFSCERDIWMRDVVLEVSADKVGSTVTAQARCAAADRLARQVTRSVSKATLARRPLASPSVVGLDMCGGLKAGDLTHAPGGGFVTITHGAYPYHCSATNSDYVLGIQAVFHKAALKPRGSTTVRGHRLVWFDPEIGTVCQVVSIQKPTANAAIVEGVAMYLIGKTGRATGQRLCSVLTTEAAKVLDRLKLS